MALSELEAGLATERPKRLEVAQAIRWVTRTDLGVELER